MENNKTSANGLLLTACVISFVCFLGAYMRVPIVPLLATSLGADTVQVGLINGAFMLMAGALSIPAGLISDRMGRRVPLLGGLILLAGSSLLLYWSENLVQMAVIYLFFGIGMSAFSPTLMSYVADFTTPDKLGRAYGWYTMALYAGMTVGPAAGGFLSNAIGLRSVFLVSGGLISAMLFVALIFLPRTTTPPRSAGTSQTIIPALKALMRNRRFVACLIATVGGCAGFGMFTIFMPLYIHSLQMDAGQVGFVFATQALANALSRLPSGRICDGSADRSLMVTCGLALFAVALAAFGICHSALSLMAVAALMGLSMGVTFTVICAMIADVVPGELRGLAMGCYNTCIYAGMLLSSVGLGTIIRGSGFRAGFFLSGAIVVLAMLAFRAVYRCPDALGYAPGSPCSREE